MAQIKENEYHFNNMIFFRQKNNINGSRAFYQRKEVRK